MVTTFLALGALILLMRVLQSVFPGTVKPKLDVKDQNNEKVQLEENQLEEMAVALAVGICLLERQGAMTIQDPSLGDLLFD